MFRGLRNGVYEALGFLCSQPSFVRIRRFGHFLHCTTTAAQQFRIPTGLLSCVHSYQHRRRNKLRLSRFFCTIVFPS